MKNSIKVVRVPAIRKSAVLFPDLHIPKQDAHAVALVKRYAKQHKADVLVLTGDVMDSAAFGRHGHKPQDEQVGKYFDDTIDFLTTLRAEFPNALIYWTEGNHDLWFAKYIQNNARVLQNDKYFSLQARLQLDKLDIIYLNEETILRFGDLYIWHGHQFFHGRYSSDNPAKQVYGAMLEATIIGHVHRPSFWHKKKPTSTSPITCYSTGCLSELAPSYNPTANYLNGFAHLRREKGRTIVRNLIIDKEILF